MRNPDIEWELTNNLKTIDLFAPWANPFQQTTD
jgi:hypothetical protein